MSSFDFFCFVEGVDNDKFVYSQITSSIFKENNLKVKFQAANELTASGKQGGKAPLIDFFNFLDSKGLLSADFQGKRSSFIFLLDKDVDEFRGEKVTSKHVFYTAHYDLQNYLFIHGNVINSAAACASIPVDTLTQTLGEQSNWLNNCLTKWKEWVTICLFLRKYDISLGGYAVSSKINSSEFGPIDKQEFETYKNLVLSRSDLDKENFDTAYSEVEVAVNELYDNGQANQIFKGKWYLHWLENHLTSNHKVNTTRKSLAITLSSNLDWDGQWTQPYKLGINQLIQEVSPDIIYQSASGGGAKIVDKYSKAEKLTQKRPTIE